MKIPARYVSVISRPSSQCHARMDRSIVPGHGWRGLDPTHNCQIGETYIKIGNGRDYGDVPPISGNYRGTRDHNAGGSKNSPWFEWVASG